MANRRKLIYQIKVTLSGITPPVWRRIQIPTEYSFWDLHVAIQDAMGWLDYHLHLFDIKKGRRTVKIGIPDDEGFDEGILPDWEVNVGDYLSEPGDSVYYDYDFGDGWTHSVLLEGVLLREQGEKYPKCIGGARACPPEDCGGVGGYYDLIETLTKRGSRRYREMVDWLQNHAKNYYPYKPDHFDPREIHFWDPKKRWKIAFEDEGV